MKNSTNYMLQKMKASASVDSDEEMQLETMPRERLKKVNTDQPKHEMEMADLLKNCLQPGSDKKFDPLG